MKVVRLGVFGIILGMKRLPFYSDPSIIANTPLAAMVLIDGANFGQLFRMWNEHTAAGQNLWSWLSVWVALVLFLNFYRVCCPQQRIAFWCTVVGLFMNTSVWLTVVYFRYIV